jgi:hypothetical protein
VDDSSPGALRIVQPFERGLQSPHRVTQGLVGVFFEVSRLFQFGDLLQQSIERTTHDSRSHAGGVTPDGCDIEAAEGQVAHGAAGGFAAPCGLKVWAQGTLAVGFWRAVDLAFMMRVGT